MILFGIFVRILKNFVGGAFLKKPLPQILYKSFGGVRTFAKGPDKKTSDFRLVLIRMLTVGAIIDRPRAYDERPYKQISAENLFSLQICVIMELTKSLPPRGRWHGAAVTEGACVTLGLC